MPTASRTQRRRVLSNSATPEGIQVFAIRLPKQGMSSDQVAEALGVGRESVFRWKRQAQEGGTEAPRIKKAPGRLRRSGGP